MSEDEERQIAKDLQPFIEKYIDNPEKLILSFFSMGFTICEATNLPVAFVEGLLKDGLEAMSKSYNENKRTVTHG